MAPTPEPSGTRAADVSIAQEQVDVLPAVGVSENRYELMLIDAGFIKQVSAKYDLQADGTVTTTGEPCHLTSPRGVTSGVRPQM